jgi:hypothetical protein
MNPDRDQATSATQLTLPLPYPGDRPESLLPIPGTPPTRRGAKAARPNQTSDGPSDNHPARRSRSSSAGRRVAGTDGLRRARSWHLDERTCEIGRRGVEAARALLGDHGAGENRSSAGQAEPPVSGGRGAGRAA